MGRGGDTAFKMPAEEVDKLRDVAHRLLVESQEFQKLLRELKWGRGENVDL